MGVRLEREDDRMKTVMESWEGRKDGRDERMEVKEEERKGRRGGNNGQKKK